MEKHRVDGGVKVTYIETRFVTSDAEGFKDLVQRLTGRSHSRAGDKPGAPAAAAGPKGCGHASSPSPGLDETCGGGDFAGLLYGGSSSQDAQCGHGGYYSFSDYFPC